MYSESTAISIKSGTVEALMLAMDITILTKQLDAFKLEHRRTPKETGSPRSSHSRSLRQRQSPACRRCPDQVVG